MHRSRPAVSSDVDRYLDSDPVNWSHALIDDGELQQSAHGTRL